MEFGRRGWTRTSDPQLRRLMLYPPELRARICFQRHPRPVLALFDTTVAISVVRDHHLHYIFAPDRHQLSTFNWLIIIYLQRIVKTGRPLVSLIQNPVRWADLEASVECRLEHMPGGGRTS